MKKIFWIFLIGLFVAILSNGVAHATCTCNVSPSGTEGDTDADAIQACIDGFGSSGGQVVLASGTFYINSPIILKSNITIQGDGASSTTLQWVTDVSDKSYMLGYEDSSSGLSNVTIQDLKIDGQDYWIIGVKFDGGGTGGRVTQVTVRDAEIVNCGEYGIHIKQTDGVFIRDITLSHSGFNDYDDDTRYAEGNIYALNHNIYLRHVTKAFVENVQTSDAAGNGINISESSYESDGTTITELPGNIVLSNITASYNGQNGVRIANSNYVKITSLTTTSYNGTSLDDGSMTCFVDDNLCNGIEFRTEDDCDDGATATDPCQTSYDGVTYGCIEDSTSNYNYSYWLYINSSSSYELDNNSKSGNCTGFTGSDCDGNGDSDANDKYESGSSTSVSGVCESIPTDGGVWPFNRTGDADPGTGSTDCDGDGYESTADGGSDCNDDTLTGSGINRGASETCNGTDDDCDGSTDEDFGSTTCGVGACQHTVSNCSGGVTQTCNSFEGASSEICNGIDDDCDGSTDESDAVDPITWYADEDVDGFGNASNSQVSCTQPTGYVTDNTDCYDSDPTIYPGAPEACGENKNCDEITVSCDTDGDGLSDADEAVLGTSISDSDSDDDGLSDGDEVSRGTDPNDTDSDNDSLSDYQEVQNGSDPTVYTDIITPILEMLLSSDDDGDGYDSEDDGGEDCKDEDPSIYPGATETCGDGIDQDCSGNDTSCDTDGDGINDTDEVAEGSDPNDPLSVACIEPDSGTEWTITHDCTLFSSKTWSGNLYVQDGAVVTIPLGISLDLDLSQKKLVIQSGSGVLIEQGGSLK